MPHQGAHARPGHPAEQRTPVGVIGGVAAGYEKDDEGGKEVPAGMVSNAIHATLLAGKKASRSWLPWVNDRSVAIMGLLSNRVKKI
jgi:hypothetical protein